MAKVKTKANGNIILTYHKINPEVNDLKFATKGSACFDLEYNPHGKGRYTGYDVTNAPFDRPLNNLGQMTIMPGDRAMVPTGIIFDIPDGYSIRVHPRSGISLKQGLSLVNCEGVIDADYVEETFLLVINHSNVKAIIDPGTRLAQAELIPIVSDLVLETTENKPEKKTERDGGMGSTGTK